MEPFGWKATVAVLVSGLLAASCVGPGRTVEPRAPTLASAGEAAAALAGTHDAPLSPPAIHDEDWTDELLSPPAVDAEDPTAAGDIPYVSADARIPARGTESGGRQVSLRPRDNADADDLLDHWGHRRGGLALPPLSPPPEPDEEAGGFRALLEAARDVDAESAVSGLRGDDPVSVLGQRNGVAWGRWSGGSADTLSIEFDLTHAPEEMRSDARFRRALELAGKIWSRRIEDTWAEWERAAGESKGRLVGNATQGRDIRVAPGGETSTGIVIYVTGVDFGGNTVGKGGARSVRPDAGWEPHTGAIGFDNDYVAEAGDVPLLQTMVHEIGHILGAWTSDEYVMHYAPHIEAYIDMEAGTWSGPRTVEVHGGPVPFQDSDDTEGWHDGERSPHAHEFDFAHSGVCASVMAYCRDSAAVPGFLPAEIDFAFLEDLGLTIREETDRPETYGLGGWLEHSAFALSVSRELDVSLADPQPRYYGNGAKWDGVDAVDLLWAEVDAFGSRSLGDVAASFPRAGTVRYTGGMIGAALEYGGFPPVYGDANLWFDLDTLAGEASFTSLAMAYGGGRYVFGSGSLQYPIVVEDNAIGYEAPGVSLAADFYGPRHEEVAGTLDDSRAGLLAGFGARRDERPVWHDVAAEADHVGGIVYADNWYRYRCGAGPECEERFKWWEPDSEWRGVAAAEGASPRERVLGWTTGWGEWISEDMFADLGGIRIARRYSAAHDGGTGRRERDGYIATMRHAAFGVGFDWYDGWERPDDAGWESRVTGAGFHGTLSGSAPAGRATWEGRMLARQSGLAAGEDPFLYGRARVSVSLGGERVDIGFSDVRSMDLRRSLEDFGFENVPLDSDGSFEGFDGGHVEGAFFGPAHDEVAGVFQKNDSKTTGSFGGVAAHED